MAQSMKKWTSLLLVFALVVTMFPLMPSQSAANTERITITGIYTKSTADGSAPEDMNQVTRVTSSPISISATIENISDSQISGLYYEVTNVLTGRTEVITSAQAFKTGPFDIAFNNVALSEGLNKIVIKYGTTNVISSAPGWVIYTPTVEIQDLQVNGENFVDNRIYPTNPSVTRSVNITGRAPNANRVLAYRLGDPNPIASYFNNGNFILIADDINNPNATANLRLTPGDNFLTFVAESTTRTYRTDRNLVYDNGGPFAFNALISQDGTEWKRLVENPTVTDPNVTVSALLKVDLNTLGLPQYQYVDVNISGQSYGPFNLGGATPATRVNTITPNSLYEGGGTIYFAVSGTSLDGINVDLRDRNGNSLSGDLSLDTDFSSDTIRLYEFTGSLSTSSQPYTFLVDWAGETIHSQTIQVLAHSAGQSFTNVTLLDLDSDIHQGYTTPLPEGRVQFSGAVAASDLSVRVVRLDGQSVGAATLTTSGSATQHEFELPSNLNEGEYKLQVLQYGRLLTEMPFRVLAPKPLTPVIQGVFETEPANLSNGPTYFSVRGQHFGRNIDDIINAVLVNDADATDTIALDVHEVRDDYIVFKVTDQSNLTHGNTYFVQFEKVHARDGLGAVTESETVQSAPVIVPEDPSTHDASAPVIDDLTANSSGELQFHQSVTTRTLKITGTNLTSANMANTYFEIWNAQGTAPVGSGGIDVGSADGSSVEVLFPSTLEAGTYMARIEFDNDRVIGMFPITIAHPVATSYEIEGNTITINGSFFGTPANEDLYRLKLEPHDENLTAIGPLNPQAGSLRGDSLRFTLPTLEPGIYDIVLIYSGDELTNNTMTYSATASADLTENAAWSQPGRYNVYDFSVDLTIPSERYQVIEFRFYNFDSVDSPTSTFWFNYEDPTLPYVDFVTSGSAGFRLSETVPNEVSEQPLTLNIYTNDQAEGVDVYIGEYTVNSVPKAYSETYTTDSNYPNHRVFRVTLDGIPNGLTDLTVVPYRGSVTDSSKVVNESGKRDYELRISSTPYIIIDNLYNGQVVRKEDEELSCTNPVQARCVSGRLVNVPLDNTGELIPGRSEVRVWFNESLLNASALNMNNTHHGNFRLQLPASFNEGRNTLRFEVLIDGQLVTETEIEFFRFSTEAPQFISVSPIDDGEVQRFLPGSLESSFVTTETGVAFRGQFANARSIELTVRTRDENGNPIVRSDRRYGSNFGSREPVNDNPQFFRTVNGSNGRFETNTIPLTSGDTIFEFTISNESNITVTRTITINREPQPYVVISPRLVKNARGEDQANINKNFVMVEIEAEGADEVVINREVASRREVTDNTGVTRTIFYREIRNIRAGRTQKVDFTVTRGTQSVSGSFLVFNAGTSIEGAQFKAPISNRMNVFNGQLQLSFPRNTYLMRNDPTKVNQFITQDRQILFGIANAEDGRVDKWKHPAAQDGQLDNPNPLVSLEGSLLLAPPNRFRAASNLFWIDAGTIRDNPDDLEEAYTGSGRLPYEHERFYARNEDDLVVPTNIGSLTLQYDPIIRNEAWRYVTVFHYDIFMDHTGHTAYRWRNLGGVVDTRNNTITVPLERFGYYQVMYLEHSYDDVISHPWARHDLDALISKGYMVAKESERFIPNDPITRGEFATLLVKIFDIPLQYPDDLRESTFSDVQGYMPDNNGLYDYRYIETAARAGIVRGTTGGRFNPDDSIRREDAAVMIARAANMRMNNDPDRVLRSLQTAFTDANLIDPYARPAVEAVSRAGLITGKENVLLEGQNRPTYRFDPKESMTRAEAASIALRVLAQQRKIPR